MIEPDSEADSPPSAVIPASLAVIFLIIFYFRLSPAGPWGEPKFTNGVVGSSALVCLYFSWYRFTFRRAGVLIPVRELVRPQAAGVKAGIFSLICIFLSHTFGGTALLPGASGLVILVIGFLGTLQSLYLLTLRNQFPEQLSEEMVD